jgi:hypothetical protein
MGRVDPLLPAHGPGCLESSPLSLAGAPRVDNDGGFVWVAPVGSYTVIARERWGDAVLTR